MPTEKRKLKKAPNKKKTQDLLRRKNLLKIVVEDGGKTSVGKLMRKVGYSKAYAKNPQKIKKSLSWEELMEKHFSDEKLAEVEGKQLNAAVIQNYVFAMAMTDEEIAAVIAKTPGAVLLKISHGATNNRAYFTTPDNASIGKSLDRIYKMKLKYPKDKSDNAVNERVDAALERFSKLLP
jgi:hypothetical protein